MLTKQRKTIKIKSKYKNQFKNIADQFFYSLKRDCWVTIDDNILK